MNAIEIIYKVLVRRIGISLVSPRLPANIMLNFILTVFALFCHIVAFLNIPETVKFDVVTTELGIVNYTYTHSGR
jgi:hypothetical protein